MKKLKDIILDDGVVRKTNHTPIGSSLGPYINQSAQYYIHELVMVKYFDKWTGGTIVGILYDNQIKFYRVKLLGKEIIITTPYVMGYKDGDFTPH